MDKSDLINRYKCGERNFIGADLSDANLHGINLRGANLSEANLSEANLSGINLSKANLGHANLWNSDLSEANLREANLCNADLSEANLRYTNLWNANLWNADLGSANLSFANLSRANLGLANLLSSDLSEAKLRGASFWNSDLSEANLRGANLWNANLGYANLGYANLGYANLGYANFSDANLRGTVLDPTNEFDPLFEEEFLRAGFEVDGGMVVGYRTKRSVVCGDTTYVPGKTYTAPVFSTDTETECHPGIYLAPLSWMKRKYKGWSLVKISAKIPDVLRCGDKWRARKIVVIEDYEEKENGQKDIN